MPESSMSSFADFDDKLLVEVDGTAWQGWQSFRE